MKKEMIRLSVVVGLSACLACGGDSGNESGDVSNTGDGAVAAANGWDESDSSQGELSGDLANPTSLTLALGDNFIVGTSVPGPSEECMDNPDGTKAPYYPEHVSYTDAFTFTLAADQKLSKILVESIEMEAVHSACDLPMESQMGAFTALANSDQIDWTSDTFDTFVSMPVEHPLVGIAFAKAAGDDLMAQFKAGFSFGPYTLPALAEEPSDGTYTFWWKEGANNTSYRLNFVVEAK